MQRLLEKIREILRNRRTRRLFSRAVSLVAAFLVFVTTYALVLPAITLEKTASCGMDEHQHSDSCYKFVLICGQEESEGHHHDDSCYTVTKELNCQLEEHRHSREAGCYDEEGNLICQISEHTHDDSCYREVKTLTCGREESEGHHHTDACYEKVLVCGKEVHTHSQACYKDDGNAGETDEEAADQASSVSRPEDSSGEKTAETAAEEDLSENYVPELDPLNMEAVFGKNTGFYYFHAEEGQETPSNSTEITDWRRVKEDTKLAPTDLVKMYLPYSISAGSLNGTNPTARYRLPANIHLTDEQIKAINKNENGITAGFSKSDPEYRKYLGAEAIEGNRAPDELLKDGTQEYISAVVRAENVYENDKYLGQDLIFTFVPYTIAKNQKTFDKGKKTVSAGKEVTGWFACDFRLDQIDWIEEEIEEETVEEEAVEEGTAGEEELEETDRGAADPAEITVEKIAEILFVSEDKTKDIKEIKRMLKLVDSASEEEKNGEETQEFQAGTLTADGDGYKITLDYTEEAKIPENASLSVREITAEIDQEAYEACLAQAQQHVDESGEAKSTVDSRASRFFDIEIQMTNEDGTTQKIEPAAPVSVNIQIVDSSAAETDSESGFEEAQKQNADPTVLHFAEDGVEQIEATSESVPAESGSENISGDTSIESKSAEVRFEAESFSIYGVVYTVDFHWEVDGKMYEFSLPGGGFVSLEHVVEVLGITDDTHNEHSSDENGDENESETTENGTEIETIDSFTLSDVVVSDAAREFAADVESVDFSSPELVDVCRIENDTTVGQIKENRGLEVQYSAELTEEQTEEINAQTVEAGDWALISVQPFTSEETLTVTMKDGEVFTIRVTDAQIKKRVIDARGETWEITVTYSKDAQIPDGSELRVHQYEKEDPEYRKANDLIASDNNTMNNGIGDEEGSETQDNEIVKDMSESADDMLAFDISIFDSKGNIVEPKSEVAVDIRLTSLPEGVDVELLKETIQVHHIVKVDGGESAVLVADTSINSQGTVSVEKDGMTASFVTDSFSVYTINWGANNNQTLRLHFVDEEGNDLTTDHTVTYNETEIGGGTVSISNSNTGILQFDSNGELDLSGFKIDGYTLSNTHKGTSKDLYDSGNFRHAIIGNKLRWNNGNLQYQAFYTNSDKAGSGWYNVGRTPNSWNVNTSHGNVNDNQTTSSRDYYLVYDPVRPAGSGSSGTGGIDLEELPELEKSKSLSSNRDGTYNLSLSVADTAIKKEIDNDINVIIIIDTSSSMVNNTTDTGNTRLKDTKEAVKALVSDLSDLNSSQNPDAVELALITFNLNANTVPVGGETWTTDDEAYNRAVDGIGTAQGTNWAQALQKAYSMKGHDNDPTYVLFLTDGAPSQYWQTSYSYFVDGEGCYLGAREEARRVATSGMYFYGVFAFGNSTDEQKGYLKHLANYAYNDPKAQDTYSFYVREADALKNKLKEIVQTIKLTYGYSDVKIYDGITELTTVTFEHVDPESFTYTISYKDYTDPDDITVYEEKEMTFTADNNGTIAIPAVEYGRLVKDDLGNYVVKQTTTEAVTIKGAEFTAKNGAADKNVTWNLQKPDGSYYILEDGWNYQVNFKIWPSQPTYDLIAALNNDLLDWGDDYTYVDGSGIQQTIPFSKYESQIDKNVDSYSLKTNTEAYVTYKKVIEKKRNGESTYVEKDSGRKDLNQPPNMPLDNTWIKLQKVWNTTLSSEDYDKISAVDLYVIEDPTEDKINTFNDAYSTYIAKQNPTSEETAAFEAAFYRKITLQKGNDWKGNLSIAPGIYDKDKKFKTTGHTYMVLEPGIDNHYELEATPTHPMLDGRTLNTQTDMVDTYKDSENPTSFDMDQETAVYSVANTLKAGINIYKYVQDASGEVEEDYNEQEFTFKISLFDEDGLPVYSHNDQDGDGALAYRIYADTTVPEGAEVTADGYRYKGYQYKKQFDDQGVLTGYMARGSIGNTGVIELKTRPRPSQYIRIVNVPLGTYYTVEETGGITGTGYEFVKVISEAARQGAVQGTSETISAPNPPKTGRRKIVPDAENNVSFYNKRKIVDINIEKSDEDGNLLSGAVFNLQAKNASNIYQDVTLITGGRGYADIRFNNGKSGTDDEELGTMVIGANPGVEGSGMTYRATFTTPEYTDVELGEEPLMTLKHLPDGEYQLTEIMAPDGYVLTLKPIDFKVANGVVTFLSSANNTANSDLVTFTPAGEETLVKIKVQNISGASLPYTGGSGTSLIYILGLLLTGLAAAGLVMRKHRMAA